MGEKYNPEEQFYLFVIGEYEKKLKELMGEKEFVSFVQKVSKEEFKKEVDGMENSDFKEFIKKNFDKITKQEDEDEKAKGRIYKKRGFKTLSE